MALHLAFNKHIYDVALKDLFKIYEDFYFISFLIKTLFFGDYLKNKKEKKILDFLLKLITKTNIKKKTVKRDSDKDPQPRARALCRNWKLARVTGCTF